jgi:lipid II:glycine glycyltransferase (peptidoglycan interpeptide bridge formation enzyme)
MLRENNFRIFDPIHETGWDALIAGHPRASFFHSSNWARVLVATYGHVPHYLGLMQEQEARALLPIFEVNSLLSGRRGVALPFSDECELLARNKLDGNQLIQNALELGRARRWKYLEVRGRFPESLQPVPWVSYCGHEIDLSSGVDTLFARFDASVRQAIRKAEKAHVQTWVLTTLEAVQTFFKLHCLTRQRHGVPPQSFAFFRNIQQLVLEPGNGFIVLATHEDQPIAAGVFVHYGRAGMYKFGASDPSRLRLRGNDLVMWEAIKWYVTRGYSRFSMGRTAPSNKGLRRFKGGFGSREYPIDYFRYDLRRERFLTGHEEKSGWVNRVCAKCPIFFLQILGKFLYRQIH